MVSEGGVGPITGGERGVGQQAGGEGRGEGEPWMGPWPLSTEAVVNQLAAL